MKRFLTCSVPSFVSAPCFRKITTSRRRRGGCRYLVPRLQQSTRCASKQIWVSETNWCQLRNLEHLFWHLDIRLWPDSNSGMTPSQQHWHNTTKWPCPLKDFIFFWFGWGCSASSKRSCFGTTVSAIRVILTSNSSERMQLLRTSSRLHMFVQLASLPCCRQDDLHSAASWSGLNGMLLRKSAMT